MGSNYGEVQLALKPGIKQRSTYTVGDSLDDTRREGAHAGCITNPSSHDIAQQQQVTTTVDGWIRTVVRAHNGQKVAAGLEVNDWKVTEIALDGREAGQITPRYIEAQVFGGVKLQDIAEVRIPRNTKLAPTTEKKLQEAGVTVVRIPSPYKTLTDYNIYDGWDSIYKE